MKYLIVLFFLSTLLAEGQNIDSLNQRILELETNQRNINLHLLRHERQFKVGISIMITGAILYGIGEIATNTERVNSNTGKPFISTVGGALFCFGAVVQVKSYAFLRKARKRGEIK